MRYWIFVLAAFFVCRCQVIAKPPENPVTLIVGSIPGVEASAGDTIWVTVPLRVARGYHVNANPAASEDYIPLEVKLDSTRELQPGITHYPQGKKWRLEGSTEDLLVYGGDIEVVVPVVIARNADPGERVVKGTIDYQACNYQVCFLPETRQISITVRVLAKR